MGHGIKVLRILHSYDSEAYLFADWLCLIYEKLFCLFLLFGLVFLFVIRFGWFFFHFLQLVGRFPFWFDKLIYIVFFAHGYFYSSSSSVCGWVSSNSSSADFSIGASVTPKCERLSRESVVSSNNNRFWQFLSPLHELSCKVLLTFYLGVICCRNFFCTSLAFRGVSSEHLPRFVRFRISISSWNRLVIFVPIIRLSFPTVVGGLLRLTLNDMLPLFFICIL